MTKESDRLNIEYEKRKLAKQYTKNKLRQKRVLFDYSIPPYTPDIQLFNIVSKQLEIN